MMKRHFDAVYIVGHTLTFSLRPLFFFILMIVPISIIFFFFETVHFFLKYVSSFKCYIYNLHLSKYVSHIHYINIVT